MINYIQFYRLESYLFDVVQPRFSQQGWINAFDFFCIIVWKANRAKSKVANKILSHAKGGAADLESSIVSMTTCLAARSCEEDRMRCLIEDWGFRLPMASAILTVLYPDDFTVYDARVCGVLKQFEKLGNVTKFPVIWSGYHQYKNAVIQATPAGLSLRDKDRYLWGKSFADQLQEDIRTEFAS